MKKLTATIAATAAIAACAVIPNGAPALAHGRNGHGGFDVWRDLIDAARVSAPYHRPATALRHGFVPFAIPQEVGGTLLTIDGDAITCFDSPDGGMGVHYVRNIDEHLDPADPEALVYAIDRRGHRRLVALEYLIPEEFVDPSSPPVLFGQTMHHHPYLPVYILHAWIWKWNPDGLFADFNPRVPACPTSMPGHS